ncbi:MAG: hypothetical protein WA347_02625 [Rhabdochlamydiaceae bacterium]|jgi:hypothetical protein
MSIRITTSNVTQENRFQFSTSRLSNVFKNENFLNTLKKVKEYAAMALQGILFAFFVISFSFAVGFGFFLGKERAMEIFNRILRK